MIMTKTTHCNNDFQAELMKMLRDMGVSTNSTLTLSNENNGWWLSQAATLITPQHHKQHL